MELVIYFVARTIFYVSRDYNMNTTGSESGYSGHIVLFVLFADGSFGLS